MVKKMIFTMMKMTGEMEIMTSSTFMEEHSIHRSKHEEEKEQN
jgi:hypothetical protein